LLLVHINFFLINSYKFNPPSQITGLLITVHQRSVQTYIAMYRKDRERLHDDFSPIDRVTSSVYTTVLIVLWLGVLTWSIACYRCTVRKHLPSDVTNVPYLPSLERNWYLPITLASFYCPSRTMFQWLCTGCVFQFVPRYFWKSDVWR